MACLSLLFLSLSLSLFLFLFLYLSLSLSQVGMNAAQQEHVRNLLQISVLKMKYDAAEYNFSNPGEQEETFLLFRGNLRVLLCNIAQLVSKNNIKKWK